MAKRTMGQHPYKHFIICGVNVQNCIICAVGKNWHFEPTTTKKTLLKKKTHTHLAAEPDEEIAGELVSLLPLLVLQRFEQRLVVGAFCSTKVSALVHLLYRQCSHSTLYRTFEKESLFRTQVVAPE